MEQTPPKPPLLLTIAVVVLAAATLALLVVGSNATGVHSELGHVVLLAFSIALAIWLNERGQLPLRQSNLLWRQLFFVTAIGAFALLSLAFERAPLPEGLSHWHFLVGSIMVAPVPLAWYLVLSNRENGRVQARVVVGVHTAMVTGLCIFWALSRR